MNRRNFLKGAAALPALAVLPVLPALAVVEKIAPKPMPKGNGRITAYHGATPPGRPAPQAGDLWFEFTTGRVWHFDGQYWTHWDNDIGVEWRRPA